MGGPTPTPASRRLSHRCLETSLTTGQDRVTTAVALISAVEVMEVGAAALTTELGGHPRPLARGLAGEALPHPLSTPAPRRGASGPGRASTSTRRSPHSS